MDATEQFFDELATRGHEPLLQKASGSVRIELVDGKRVDRRLIEIARGDIAVSRRTARADCVLRMEKALFDGIVTGRVNATAALLRGAMRVEGDVQLIVLLQRLFPGSKDARHARPAGYAKRRA